MDKLTPRNGDTLVVGIVARISGGSNQKELSLGDQEDHARQVVAEMYGGPAEYRVIATTGKGERLDRPELAEIEALLRSRTLDLLVCEDIGRMVRGTEASRLCGIAVDHGVRVIAPNDCIDTAEDAWEEDVISACRDHVGHNAHTSKRLKQKLMNRFTKFGGATARPIFGYVVPPDAHTYADWRKDEAATAVYEEWFRLLRAKPNCSAVADWLNATAAPIGPYCRGKKWTGQMVRRITQNPLLKGMPERGRRHTVKHHESGRRVEVPNPKGAKVWACPHLAFVTPDEFDEVNALVDAANDGAGRKPRGPVAPPHRVLRDRTLFPGRSARCAYCGREYVWGGNGITANLMCNGARAWECWNSIGFNGETAARRTVAALTDQLYRLAGFDAQFREMVDEAHRADDRDAGRPAEIARRADALARQKRNLLDAVREVGPSPTLRGELAAVEADEAARARDRRELDARRSRPLALPGTVAELRALFEAAFADLAIDSYEFADLLRSVVTEFHVGLVRLCDGGHLLPRARVALDLSGIAPDLRSVPGAPHLLRREVTLDLFDPPQREVIRPDVVRLAAEGMGQRRIARDLGVTQAAVSNAARLDRKMRAAGMADPFVVVTEVPADYTKLRRLKHERYRFEPLPGYPRRID
jgi:hypothetical protein